ncbi:hypothetical protein HII31_04951 [Pseudocercospora fuligena]|uniref:Plasmid pRiA4b Orf3-like domain-containing protein n=1 Tax=Pseudocercospora fuligena TaxID=685502 RepID=A0A8H6RP63_9PEZI|nr:hypothetical protein HII31_04951 [Pseudocercospora fuligena]
MDDSPVNDHDLAHLARGPGAKDSSQRVAWNMARDKIMSQIPLDEPGYLLIIEQKWPYNEANDNGIQSSTFRMLRVPTSISFHQLHNICERALSWQSGHEYEFALWDLPFRNALYEPDEPGMADKAKEVLVEAPAERFVEFNYEEWPEKYKDNYRSSKNRKLSQVFGGSRIWREIPHKIEYEIYIGQGWEYVVHFLGETDDQLEKRPGQEVFCISGKGHPLESNPTLARQCSSWIGMNSTSIVSIMFWPAGAECGACSNPGVVRRTSCEAVL